MQQDAIVRLFHALVLMKKYLFQSRFRPPIYSSSSCPLHVLENVYWLMHINQCLLADAYKPVIPFLASVYFPTCGKSNCKFLCFSYIAFSTLKSQCSFNRVQEHGGETIIPFSGALERDLTDLPPEEAAKYCEENKVQRLVRYQILKLCILYNFIKSLKV